MKILNWLHRRMHAPADQYRRVPGPQKKDPYSEAGGVEDDADKEGEMEKVALLMDLRHVEISIQQVLDGILAVGTLGHPEYDFFQPQLLAAAPHLADELPPVAAAAKEEHAVSEEEKKEVAAVVTSPAACNPAAESFKNVRIRGLPGIIHNGGSNNAAADDDVLEPLLQACHANKRERITLADLFLESTAARIAPERKTSNTKKLAPSAAGIAPERKASNTKKLAPSAAGIAPERQAGNTTDPAFPPGRAKHAGPSSITKKLTLWKKKKAGEDSPRATEKSSRMISKMLKKKIHPE